MEDGGHASGGQGGGGSVPMINTIPPDRPNEFGSDPTTTVILGHDFNVLRIVTSMVFKIANHMFNESTIYTDDSFKGACQVMGSLGYILASSMDIYMHMMLNSSNWVICFLAKHPMLVNAILKKDSQYVKALVTLAVSSLIDTVSETIEYVQKMSDDSSDARDVEMQMEWADTIMGFSKNRQTHHQQQQQQKHLPVAGVVDEDDGGDGDPGPSTWTTTQISTEVAPRHRNRRENNKKSKKGKKKDKRNTYHPMFSSNQRNVGGGGMGDDDDAEEKKKAFDELDEESKEKLKKHLDKLKDRMRGVNLSAFKEVAACWGTVITGISVEFYDSTVMPALFEVVNQLSKRHGLYVDKVDDRNDAEHSACPGTWSINPSDKPVNTMAGVSESDRVIRLREGKPTKFKTIIMNNKSVGLSIMARLFSDQAMPSFIKRMVKRRGDGTDNNNRYMDNTNSVPVAGGGGFMSIDCKPGGGGGDGDDNNNNNDDDNERDAKDKVDMAEATDDIVDMFKTIVIENIIGVKLGGDDDDDDGGDGDDGVGNDASAAQD
jgi:hypothetical protein